MILSPKHYVTQYHDNDDNNHADMISCTRRGDLCNALTKYMRRSVLHETLLTIHIFAHLMLCVYASDLKLPSVCL